MHIDVLTKRLFQVYVAHFLFIVIIPDLNESMHEVEVLLIYTLLCVEKRCMHTVSAYASSSQVRDRPPRHVTL